MKEKLKIGIDKENFVTRKDLIKFKTTYPTKEGMENAKKIIGWKLNEKTQFLEAVIEE